MPWVSAQYTMPPSSKLVTTISLRCGGSGGGDLFIAIVSFEARISGSIRHNVLCVDHTKYNRNILCPPSPLGGLNIGGVAI